MIKYVGLYFVGLMISMFFLKEAIVFFNSAVFGLKLTSVYVNDSFQLTFRIFLSFFFGAAYFFFKVQRYKLKLTNLQVIYSIVGLLGLFVFIGFIQGLINSEALAKENIFVHRLFPLWLTFPFIILYYGCLLKYIYKIKTIKWFW